MLIRHWIKFNHFIPFFFKKQVFKHNYSGGIHISDWSNNNLNVFLAKNNDDMHLHSDAFENICDEDMLKDIINGDDAINVRISAIHQIKDMDFLLDECLNNPDSRIRMAILSRILDESLLDDLELSLLLEKIILNDPDIYVLKTAFQKADLISQEAIIEVAYNRSDDEIIKEAVKNITDEKILADFAINNSSEFIRLEAISNQNLNDIDIIFKIIINDENEFNRLMAIYKIENCGRLVKIIYKKPICSYLGEISKNINFKTNDYFLNDFLHSNDDYKRLIDVLFIEDEEFLEKLILNESDDNIRAFAVKNKNFNNQAILENLIKTHSGEQILLEAISKIENQNVLMEYISKNLNYCDVTVNAISRINDLGFLEELSTCNDYRLRFEAVKRIAYLKNSENLLHKIALTENDEEICIEAIGAIDNRNILIEIADFRFEKNISFAALKKIKADRLLYNFIHSIRKSLSDLPYENALKQIALADEDIQIRCIATSRLNDVAVLKKIASSNDLTNIIAQKRLNTLFDDIKSLDSLTVLDKLIMCGDEAISRVAQDTLDDLASWQDRISQVNDISDIDTLKEISNNDFNYFVRNEACGRLEKLLFNIRLDEINNKENQEKFKAIACDESFTLEIRKKALLNIADEEFVNDFDFKL